VKVPYFGRGEKAEGQTTKLRPLEQKLKMMCPHNRVKEKESTRGRTTKKQGTKELQGHRTELSPSPTKQSRKKLKTK